MVGHGLPCAASLSSERSARPSTSARPPSVYGCWQSHRRGVGSVQQRRTPAARQGAQHGRRCGATSQRHAVAAPDPLGRVIFAPRLGPPPLDHEMAALCGVLVDHGGAVGFGVSSCLRLHIRRSRNDSGLYDSRYRVDEAAAPATAVAITRPAQHNPRAGPAAWSGSRPSHPATPCRHARRAALRHRLAIPAPTGGDRRPARRSSRAPYRGPRSDESRPAVSRPAVSRAPKARCVAGRRTSSGRSRRSLPVRGLRASLECQWIARGHRRDPRAPFRAIPLVVCDSILTASFVARDGRAGPQR